MPLLTFCVGVIAVGLDAGRLRAAPRKYQLDVEIVKKWPGLKLS